MYVALSFAARCWLITLEQGLPRHLTASVDVLAPSVYQKLHEIRTSIVTLIETTDEQIKHAQDEMEEALETERFALVAEKLARTAAEKQLEEAAIQIAASEKLVFDFANDRLFAGPAMEGTPVKRGAMYEYVLFLFAREECRTDEISATKLQRNELF